MKTPVKKEKSWAGKTYDKLTATNKEPAVEATIMMEKKPPMPHEKLPMTADKHVMAPPVEAPAAPVILSDDMKKRAEEEAARRKAEKEEKAKRAPGRKAGAHYVDEKDYPKNNEVVLASVPTVGVALLQYRYAADSAAKGDFYANIAGSWSSLVGKVNAWMSVPEF